MALNSSLFIDELIKKIYLRILYPINNQNNPFIRKNKNPRTPIFFSQGLILFGVGFGCKFIQICFNRIKNQESRTKINLSGF